MLQPERFIRQMRFDLLDVPSLKQTLGCAGSLAGSPLGFSSVFYICAAVYLSSFITWNLFMKGEDVQLT